jgi:glycine/D-amino acid oxidase-like deaminating enzyme
MTSIPGGTDVAIIGAGIVGIAVAHYLVARHEIGRVVLVEQGDPMALTSAQSGENYRNWWPHPVMRAFTDDAIDLMEEIARASDNRLHMTRRGYALVTRRERPDDLFAELERGYGEGAAARIRIHRGGGGAGYVPATSPDWNTAPDGVDVLMDRGLIRSHFPSYAPDVATVLHIRRAGDISGQQMGAWMLERIRAAGGRILRARLAGIEGPSPFTLRLEGPDGPATLRAERIVNAAGPFFGDVAAMLGEAVPLQTVFQQKIAFDDRERAIPRAMPFSIDLDGQTLSWTDEEREILASDPATAPLTRPMPGAIHCRPEGGDGGTWLKLGWAYNRTPSDPHAEPAPVDPHFTDVVLRGASRLNPTLAVYLGRLPRGARHYGGYYPMTPENWPLIGPMRTPGAFMAGALSGFGTMAATATGSLCAAWMQGTPRPGYADLFTQRRYGDPALMAELRGDESKGVL